MKCSWEVWFKLHSIFHVCTDERCWFWNSEIKICYFISVCGLTEAISSITMLALIIWNSLKFKLIYFLFVCISISNYSVLSNFKLLPELDFFFIKSQLIAVGGYYCFSLIGLWRQLLLLLRAFVPSDIPFSQITSQLWRDRNGRGLSVSQLECR